MPDQTTHLMRARQLAAGDLEDALEELQGALLRFAETTSALESHLRVELGRQTDTVLVLHFAQAGLSPWLDRKLAGRPTSLRTFVHAQHERASHQHA